MKDDLEKTLDAIETAEKFQNYFERNEQVERCRKAKEDLTHVSQFLEIIKAELEPFGYFEDFDKLNQIEDKKYQKLLDESENYKNMVRRDL